MNHTSSAGQGPFSALAEKARRRGVQKEQERRVAELARTIDELSEQMGINAFCDALRSYGYNVDADLGTLLRRGVDKFQH